MLQLKKSVAVSIVNVAVALSAAVKVCMSGWSVHGRDTVTVVIPATAAVAVVARRWLHRGYFARAYNGKGVINVPLPVEARRVVRVNEDGYAAMRWDAKGRLKESTQRENQKEITAAGDPAVHAMKHICPASLSTELEGS